MKNSRYIFQVLVVMFCLLTACKREKPSQPTKETTANTNDKLFTSFKADAGTGFFEGLSGLPPSGRIDLYFSTIASFKNSIDRVKITYYLEKGVELPFFDTTLQGAESFSKKFIGLDFLKVNYTGIPYIMFVGVSFQSNGQTDTAILYIQKPSITLMWNDGSGYKTTKGNIAHNQKIDLKLSAHSSPGTPISRVYITMNVNSLNLPIMWDTVFSISSPPAMVVEKEFINLPLPLIPSAKVVITARILELNKTGSTGISDVTINIKDVLKPPGVKTAINITLTAQKNTTTHSFFNFYAGENGVLNSQQADTTPGAVNLLYQHIDNVGAALVAPAYISATDPYYHQVQGWSIRNSTYIGKSYKIAREFDDILPGDFNTLKFACMNPGVNMFISPVKVGDVIACADKNLAFYALLKITSIIPGDNGSITFDMKSPVF